MEQLTDGQCVAALIKIRKKLGSPYIAYRMGYKSSVSIDKWIERKKFPNYIKDKILTLVKEVES